MSKKLLIVSGIVLLMVFTAVTMPVVAEPNDEETFGKKTRITAIGTFAHCDVDGVVYGHIFIGFIGIKPVFNFDIQICDDTIGLIIMSNHFLHCVVSK